MFQLLWKKKALIIFLVALIALLPTALARPAQMLEKAIFTTIAISHENNQYSLTGEMVINQPTEIRGEPKTILITERGATIEQVFNKISASTGREISLSHCTLIIITDTTDGKNLSTILRYFQNKTELNNNCALIYTKSDVNDLLEKSRELADPRGGMLNQIAKFNQRSVHGRPTTLERFFKDTKRIGGATIMGTVELIDDTIENPLETAVFKNGIYQTTLTKDQTLAMNFLTNNPTSSLHYLVGSEMLSIRAKKCRLKIKDNTLHIKINTTLRADNLSTTAPPPATLKPDFITQLTQDITSALTHLHALDLDVLQLHELHQRTSLREYRSNPIDIATLKLNIEITAQII
jgi:hypothetical protein